MSEFICGLCSVTFRNKSIKDIAELTSRAGLSVIEWGGDVHVPTGEPGKSSSAVSETLANGLAVSSYGSYYRLDGDAAPQFEAARSIGAKTIRMWAGSKGSADVNRDERRKIIEAARSVVAASGDVVTAFEWHGGTLTDTALSAVDFARETGAKLYWQPCQHRTFGENLAELKLMRSYLANVHVFAWEGSRKLPLSAHERQWRSYLDVIGGGTLLMEFVPDDTAVALLRDSETLLGWTR